MTDVNMGDHPSGTVAIVSLCKTAEMSSDEFPHSSETILRKSYRYDISESIKTTEEALTLISEIDKILEHDSFRIKGWAMPGEGSKIEQGAQIQNHEDKYPVQGLTGTIDDATELERVLGMGWNSSKDTLCYHVKLNFSKKKQKITKQPHLTREQIPANIPETLTKIMILSQGGCQKTGHIMKHKLLPAKTG